MHCDAHLSPQLSPGQQPFLHTLPTSMHIDLELEIFKSRFSNGTDRKPGDISSRM